MEVSITGVDSTENLRTLRTWLAEEPELRGRVRLVERPPEPGHLGTVPELILVTLGTGSATTGFATAVNAWLQHRAVDVACTVTRIADGTGITMSARQLRQADAATRGRLARELSATLAGGGANSGTPRLEGRVDG